MNTPRPNEIYRHFKGNMYRILTLAQDADTGDRVVVYQALYGDNTVYVRALTAFMERLDEHKYPYADQVHRFELLDNPMAAGNTFTGEALSRKAEVPSDRKPDADKTLSPVIEESQRSEGPFLDPLLLEFLDNSGHQERLDILERLRPRLTEEMIHIMAAALETELMTQASDTDAAYSELRGYLLTMEKYERKHR